MTVSKYAALSADWLYAAVSVHQSAELLKKALSDEHLDFERGNLFAADGILFEFAVRSYRKETMSLLVEHFEKHFAKRAEPKSSVGDVEEDFDDYSKPLSETSFTVMKENFEYVVDQWCDAVAEVDKDIMVKLNVLFAGPPPIQTA